MAKTLKEGEIEELKNHADIQIVISGYVNLKRSGKSYVGLCPFHKEKTPSFTVDPRKQLYHCFGCGEGGDIISFIMKVENLDFIEAAEFLAKKVNYNLQFIYTDTPEMPEKRSRLIEICELAKKYYKYILFNSKVSERARDYLNRRGFKKEIIEHFELGYSPESWSSFSNFAVKRGYMLKEIIESGLALQSSRAVNEIYDRFRGRIMFPIKDIVGKTIGFGGRIINDAQKSDANVEMQTQGRQVWMQPQTKSQALTKPEMQIKMQPQVKAQAKYINSPETKIYSKSKSIYGLFDAKNSIVEKDAALIVEGYTDVMTLHQEGIKNAVASLGTALTIEQIGIVGRFTKNIILVFDSDAAGVSASMRGMERLKEYNEKLDLFHESNINMKVAVLEEGYDPAEYVLKKEREKFLERVDNAVNIIDFTIDMILRKYDINSLSDKLSASDELLGFISTLSSKIVQEECIKKISEKLNLRESLLVEQLQKKSSKKSYRKAEDSVSGQEGIKRNEKMVSPLRNIEIEALKIIINGIGDKYYDLLDIGAEFFNFEDTKKLYEIIKEALTESKSDDGGVNFPLKISSDKLEDEQLKRLYNMIIFSPVNYSDNNLACLEVYNNLKRIYITGKIDEVKKRLKQFENYRKELTKLIKESSEILTKKPGGEPENKKPEKEKLEKVDGKIEMLNLKLNKLENELFKYK